MTIAEAKPLKEKRGWSLKRPLSFAAFLFVAILLLPSLARADVPYTFIKVACDPAGKTAKIKVFYVYNNEGNRLSKNHGADVYYLSDVAVREKISKVVPPRGEMQFCHFSDGQVVSFVADENKERSASNGLRLFFNGIGGIWFSFEYDWIIEVSPTVRNKFEMKLCDSDSSNDRWEESNCKVRSVQNGDIVDNPSE